MESLIRLLGTAIFAGLAIELALLGARARGLGHESIVGVAAGLFAGDAPAGFRGDGDPASWLGLIAIRAMESGRVLAMATVIAISFGYALGLLAGRFRSPAVRAMAGLPFVLMVWAPAVWVVSLCGWWLVERHRQPLVIEAFPATGGPLEIEVWWRALFPAVVLGLSVIGTQVRTIAGAIAESAGSFHVRAAIAQGFSGTQIYYGAIVRNAAAPVVESFGRVLPVMIGLQIFVEWAFAYPGLGRLMTDSARAGRFEALLAGGLILALVMVGLRWLEEMAMGFCDRRRRLPGAATKKS